MVCSAPLLDMVRYEEFSLGRTWNDEYGTAADPEELGWLLSYSPYHHVRAGHRVPGGAVHRVRVRHPGRPAARPQDVRRPAARHHRRPRHPPVLLRRETDVGHGARSVSRTVALAVDQLAFLAAHTGLELLTPVDRTTPSLLAQPPDRAPTTPGSLVRAGSTS